MQSTPQPGFKIVSGQKSKLANGLKFDLGNQIDFKITFGLNLLTKSKCRVGLNYVELIKYLFFFFHLISKFNRLNIIEMLMVAHDESKGGKVEKYEKIT